MACAGGACGCGTLTGPAQFSGAAFVGACGATPGEFKGGTFENDLMFPAEARLGAKWPLCKILLAEFNARIDAVGIAFSTTIFIEAVVAANAALAAVEAIAESRCSELLSDAVCKRIDSAAAMALAQIVGPASVCVMKQDPKSKECIEAGKKQAIFDVVFGESTPFGFVKLKGILSHDAKQAIGCK